jgi:hypothetical protein
MPHKSIAEEFGKPLSEGSKVSDDVFNGHYGTYKDCADAKTAMGGKPAPTTLDPKPFNITGSK